MNKINQKLVIYGAGGFLLFAVIIAVFFNSARKQSETKGTQPAPSYAVPRDRFPTRFPLRNGPSPTSKIASGFTGVDDDEARKYNEKYPEVELLAKLRNSMPYSTDAFNMDYSYKDLQFVVNINVPYGNNVQQFYNFLKQRNISYSVKNFKVVYQ